MPNLSTTQWLDCFHCRKQKSVFLTRTQDGALGYMQCEFCDSCGPESLRDTALAEWERINVAMRVVKILAELDLPK